MRHIFYLRLIYDTDDIYICWICAARKVERRENRIIKALQCFIKNSKWAETTSTQCAA